MNIKHYLQEVIENDASDIFIIAGIPLSYRAKGVVVREDLPALAPNDTEKLIAQIYELANHRDIEALHQKGDDDFSFSIRNLSRFRVNAYKQRGSLSAVIRVIAFSLPAPESIGISNTIMNFCKLKRGLVLVTGPAGSGKSTTLACMINDINHRREGHIITLEDPVEFLHRHRRSIVSQREVNIDTESYAKALRASLRQSPDVILLGEMRDYETISVAMTAAETGHLILSTLHTIGAANTIDRIIDVFPANQQRQVTVQLSMVLQAVISQQLIPTIDGNIVPAFEIMSVTPAIRNMIRDNKIPQIDGMLYSSTSPTLVSMDTSLKDLYHAKKITKETALAFATNPDMLKLKLKVE